MDSHRHHPQAGFTLIELSVSMALLGLLMGAVVMAAGSLSAGRPQEEAEKTLARIEQALVDYVTVTGGNLPCPAEASGSDAGEPDCTGGQEEGVPPWRVLGLSREDVLDPWGHFVTYRVHEPLTDDEHLKIDAEDLIPQAGTSPLQTFLSGDDGKGLEVWAVGDTAADDALADPSEGRGAAFILISHGPNGAHALAGDGTTVTPAGDATTEEAQNSAGSDRTTGSDAYHVADAGDDIVRWLTVVQTAGRAGLMPGS